MSQGEKSERSQVAILEAALRLFSKQGYRGTSIREIAAEAGLSTGNVYHHFPDKETLFTTLLGEYWEAIESPEFPFNKALAAGAFPFDLEALAQAAEESVRTWRRHVILIYVDVVEFEGNHIRKFYTEMAGRFETFLNKRFPDGSLKDELGDGFQPITASMLASRVFLQYFAVEILFGIPNQFGLDSATAMKEVSAILRHGMLHASAERNLEAEAR
ncbi:TetR/AcrR family transcriptional regulator [Geothrix sp. 21YS21S-2]|uniref:TetR/AcrR family transcriptional regulator n=1 Tax=Geothrix sp. 21YS21S-2 TaxID=3068893 RepID=UPI0027B94EF4|nr:TetR/AcrR family transcriptional regulator [Geothrix sp. 21YS21S-2]